MYSDAYYSGTPITIQIMGLGLGMTYQLSSGGMLSILTSTNTPPQTYPFTVLGSAFGLVRQTSGVVVVTAQAPAFDYSVTISPSTLTAELGETVNYMVIVSLVSGTGETVALNLAGLPADIKYGFSMQSGTPPYSSVLKLDLSTSTSTGTYTMTVTATGAGKSKTAAATLIVEKAADFVISVAPQERTIRQGESTSLSVIVNSLGQFGDVVTLAVSGLPSGTMVVFNPASGKPPFTSALTVSTTQTTPAGIYAATIEASGGGKKHSVTVSISIATVSAPSTLDSILANLNSLLSNPLNLILIVIVILLVVLILRSGRRRTTTSPQRPETQTGTAQIVRTR